MIWSVVYAKAERLSRRLATQRICRSFDLLHVAIAVVSEVKQLKQFATLDEKQSAVAEAAGLRVITLPKS